MRFGFKIINIRNYCNLFGLEVSIEMCRMLCLFVATCMNFSSLPCVTIFSKNIVSH